MRRRLIHRKRRDCEPEIEHQGSRRVPPEHHPVTCGCRLCLLELGAELDPDAMEDDDHPYFWNRRNW